MPNMFKQMEDLAWVDTMVYRAAVFLDAAISYRKAPAVLDKLYVLVSRGMGGSTGRGSELHGGSRSFRSGSLPDSSEAVLYRSVLENYLYGYSKRWHTIMVAVCTLQLLLGLFEYSEPKSLQLPRGVTVSVEFLCLLIHLYDMHLVSFPLAVWRWTKELAAAAEVEQEEVAAQEREHELNRRHEDPLFSPQAAHAGDVRIVSASPFRDQKSLAQTLKGALSDVTKSHARFLWVYLRLLQMESGWLIAKLVLVLMSLCLSPFALVGGSNSLLVMQMARPVITVQRLRSVRKIVNSIMKSLSNILYVLALVFSLVILFAYLGWLLFEGTPNDGYFTSPARSFTSMYVLVTTANYPNVALAIIDNSSWNALFFVVYLLLGLYLVMNLVLAVVYDTYEGQVQDDVQRYYERNVDSLQKAYEIMDQLDETELRSPMLLQDADTSTSTGTGTQTDTQGRVGTGAPSALSGAAPGDDMTTRPHAETVALQLMSEEEQKHTVPRYSARLGTIGDDAGVPLGEGPTHIRRNSSLIRPVIPTRDLEHMKHSSIQNKWTDLLSLIVRQGELQLRRKWKTDPEKVQILFRAMDLDGNRDISRNEFTRVCLYAMASFTIIPIEPGEAPPNLADQFVQPTPSGAGADDMLDDIDRRARELQLDAPLRASFSVSHKHDPASANGDSSTRTGTASSFSTARQAHKAAMAAQARKLLLSNRLEFIVDGFVLCNAIILGLEKEYGETPVLTTFEIFFVILFWTEMLYKLYTRRLHYFTSSFFNSADCLVVVLSTLFFMMDWTADASPTDVFSYLRVARVLRLVGRSERYQTMARILWQIRPVMFGILGVIAMFMYFFAVIGINLFAGKLCRDPTVCPHLIGTDYAVQDFYSHSFDGMPRAFLTLFALLVVNNWQIIMGGVVAVTGPAARLYFILFHIIAVIITLNVLVAFVLGTFIKVSKPSFQEKHKKNVETVAKDKEVIIRASAEFLRSRGLKVADLSLDDSLVAFLIRQTISSNVDAPHAIPQDLDGADEVQVVHPVSHRRMILAIQPAPPKVDPPAHAPRVAEEELAPGWERYFSREGIPYYYDAVSGAAQWTKPLPPAAQ